MNGKGPARLAVIIMVAAAAAALSGLAHSQASADSGGHWDVSVNGPRTVIETHDIELYSVYFGDDVIHTRQWTHDGPAGITLSHTDRKFITLTAPKVASDTTFRLTVTITDGGGNTLSAWKTITITNNDPPTDVDAGPDQTVTEGETVTLSGTAKDPDGDTLVYTWGQERPPTFYVPGLTRGQTLDITAPDVQYDITVPLKVLVWDGTNNPVTDEMLLTILDADSRPAPSNRPPSADAGPDQTVTEGDTVTLTGSATDPDGDTMTYEWRQSSGASVSLSDSSALTPTFTAPDVSVQETLVFVLTVTDEHGAVDTDEAHVTVYDGGSVTTPNHVTTPNSGTPVFGIPSLSLPGIGGDDTAPTITRIERVGNGTRTLGEGGPLLFNVTFSEPVVNVNATDFALLVNNMTTIPLGGNATLVNMTSHPNATIPDLGTLKDTIRVAEPGILANGTVWLDLEHIITASLEVRLVSPDCRSIHLHNQTFAFWYELAGPHGLGQLAGTDAAGPWTLIIDDHAEFWEGTLASWGLVLDVDNSTVARISDTLYQVAAWPAAGGHYLLTVADGHDIADRAGNALAGAEPRGPDRDDYLVVSADAPPLGGEAGC